MFVVSLYCILLFFFFFQAEDGIRDVAVTGVQTCALPIFRFLLLESASSRLTGSKRLQNFAQGLTANPRRPVRGKGDFLSGKGNGKGDFPVAPYPVARSLACPE